VNSECPEYKLEADSQACSKQKIPSIQCAKRLVFQILVHIPSTLIGFCQLYLHRWIVYVKTSTWCRQHKDACPIQHLLETKFSAGW